MMARLVNFSLVQVLHNRIHHPLCSTRLYASVWLLHKTQRSLESAAEEEGDFLLAVQHQRAADAFRQQLWQQKDSIAAVVRHHLGLRKTDSCTVLPPDLWIQGGFNLCVLVHVQSPSRGAATRLVFRCPMPHKLAEKQYPGTIDEKAFLRGGYVRVGARTL
jgi:hypothetical protein